MRVWILVCMAAMVLAFTGVAHAEWGEDHHEGPKMRFGIVCNSLGQVKYILQHWDATRTKSSGEQLEGLFRDMEDEGSRPRCSVTYFHIAGERVLFRLRHKLTGDMLTVSEGGLDGMFSMRTHRWYNDPLGRPNREYIIYIEPYNRFLRYTGRLSDPSFFAKDQYGTMDA